MKNIYNMSGIYMIENLSNGKVYVGQSVDIENRKKEHLRTLNKNEHHNIHLQRSWNKYGEGLFKFSIIEECEIERLNDKEIEYIKNFDSTNPSKGYNQCEGGKGSIGYKHSEKVKQQISKKQTGRKLTQEWKDNISKANSGKNPKNLESLIKLQKSRAIPIDQYDTQGNFIRRWDGTQACARGLGILATNITKCLKGKYKTSGGFVFRYADEEKD